MFRLNIEPYGTGNCRHGYTTSWSGHWLTTGRGQYAVGNDASAAQSSVTQQPATILVVEDEILVRMMIADDLRIAGFAVIEAADPDEALAVLRCGSKVHVLVTDVQMPGSIDGVVLAKLVRSELPEIKIIIASAHLPAPRAVRHDGFFSKPYNLHDIIALIRKLTA